MNEPLPPEEFERQLRTAAQGGQPTDAMKARFESMPPDERLKSALMVIAAFDRATGVSEHIKREMIESAIVEYGLQDMDRDELANAVASLNSAELQAIQVEGKDGEVQLKSDSQDLLQAAIKATGLPPSHFAPIVDHTMDGDVAAVLGVLGGNYSKIGIDVPPYSTVAKLERKSRPTVQKPEARTVEILEPVGSGLYKRFLEERRTFRTFHVTRDQYDDWFITERQPALPEGETRMLTWAMPFAQFALIPDPEWNDITEMEPSEYLKARVKERGELLVRPTKSLYRPEGITVNYDATSGIIQFTSAYHLFNEEGDKHICGAAIWNVGDLNDPEPGPRTMHIARYVSPEAHYQGFIDKLASLNMMVTLRFLDTLNHRKVRVIELPDDPFKPINRQQRRAQGWVERDHYKIYIPATLTIRRAREELSENDKKGWQVSGHERRGHLRKDRYGRKRIVVRPTTVKGGYDGRHFPIYSAHNVGMEGREDD